MRDDKFEDELFREIKQHELDFKHTVIERARGRWNLDGRRREVVTVFKCKDCSKSWGELVEIQV